MSAHASSRTAPSTPPASIFPSNITDAISARAFELLEVDLRVTSVTKGDLFALWQAACSVEGRDPNVLTHTFRSDNEFAIKAKAVKAVLKGDEF